MWEKNKISGHGKEHGHWQGWERDGKGAEENARRES